jgi:hypothetical protein
MRIYRVRFFLAILCAAVFVNCSSNTRSKKTGNNSDEQSQLSPSPREFKWATIFGTDGADKVLNEPAKFIVTDSSGNTYFAGILEEQADVANQVFSFDYFDSGRRVDISSDGDHDVYLTKVNSLGETQWVRKWGTANREQLRGLQIDESGGLFVLMYADSQSFDADPTAGTDTYGGFTSDRDMCIVVNMDLDGNYNNALVLADENGFFCYPNDLLIADGKLSIFAFIDDNIDLNPNDMLDDQYVPVGQKGYVLVYNLDLSFREYGRVFGLDAFNNPFAFGALYKHRYDSVNDRYLVVWVDRVQLSGGEIVYRGYFTEMGRTGAGNTYNSYLGRTLGQNKSFEWLQDFEYDKANNQLVFSGFVTEISSEEFEFAQPKRFMSFRDEDQKRGFLAAMSIDTADSSGTIFYDSSEISKSTLVQEIELDSQSNIVAHMGNSVAYFNSSFEKQWHNLFDSDAVESGTLDIFFNHKKSLHVSSSDQFFISGFASGSGGQVDVDIEPGSQDLRQTRVTDIFVIEF